MAPPREGSVFAWPSLGLPLRPSGSLYFASCLLAVYYAASMSRDLALFDSGELALAAVQLGLGHPPGQPLHAMLGFLGAKLCPGSALFGVNLASALPAAFTLLPAASIAQTLSGPGAAGRFQRLFSPALLLVWATHACLWEPATRTEVYALATLGAVWAVACVLPVALGLETTVPADRLLFRAGLVLGLSASANPMIALCTGFVLALCVVAPWLQREISMRGVGLAAVGGGLGLLPYVYLPLVAKRSDVIVWGGLHDRADYLRYLTLRDYAHNQAVSLDVWGEHLARWFAWSAQNMLLPVLVLGTAGYLGARARYGLARVSAPLLLLLLAGVTSFNVVWHLDVPDYNGYLATAYWVLAAGAVSFAIRLALSRRRAAVVAIVACFAATLFAPPNVLQRTRHHDHVARVLAEQVLREAPRRAIVIAMADHLAGALLYLQAIEVVRPDVTVLIYGLSGSRWYWEYLSRRHPELKAAPLVGPGGRIGRVQRWLAANATRPVLVEQWQLARELGLSTCAGGLYLRSGALCVPRLAPRTSEAVRVLSLALASVGSGSPSAAAALADVSCGLGESLWRLGEPRAAHAVLLAGVPRDAWPAHLASDNALERVAPLSASPPRWQRSAALGDPGRNLFLAAALVDGSAQTELVRGYLRAAARTNLPEAQRMLAGTR